MEIITTSVLKEHISDQTYSQKVFTLLQVKLLNENCHLISTWWKYPILRAKKKAYKHLKGKIFCV